MTIDEPASRADAYAKGADVAALAAVLSDGARAATVFGEPVRQGETLVVPVAKASWRFGGGNFFGRDRPGGGGGGALRVAPVGFIAIHGRKAAFKRSGAAPLGLVAVGLGLIAAAFLVGRAARRG